MTPDEYCEQKAAASGSSAYYAFRVLPPERRRAIAALYAFRHEVGDVLDEVSDPAVARLKLAWWRHEIAAVFSGAPQHPVALALQRAVASFALPEEPFQAVIDGMAIHLEQRRYADFAALERYCRDVAGAVGLLSAEIFGRTQSATRDYARALGIALQLTDVIRDVGADARRGRICLPQDELDRFGVSESDVLQRRAVPGFAALIAHQVARARARYEGALAQLPRADRYAQRPGLILAALGRRLLEEIERDGFAVLDRRISLTPLTKAWIAWKTSWAY